MKVVNLEAFLALPAGTVYAEYDGSLDIQALRIKDETISLAIQDGIKPCDFCYTELPGIDADNTEDLTEKIIAAEDKGKELPMDLHTYSRWGLYDQQARFLVFDGAEVLNLAQRLLRAYMKAQGLAPNPPE